MRSGVSWRYKTVLFELRKEGILGSAYLDEMEIEEALNTYGEDGWELISMLDTRDGVIAVFKQRQPLGGRPPAASLSESEPLVQAEPSDELEVSALPEPGEVVPTRVEEVEAEERVAAEEQTSKSEPEEENSGIGSIRIE